MDGRTNADDSRGVGEESQRDDAVTPRNTFKHRSRIINARTVHTAATQTASHLPRLDEPGLAAHLTSINEQESSSTASVNQQHGFLKNTWEKIGLENAEHRANISEDERERSASPFHAGSSAASESSSEPLSGNPDQVGAVAEDSTADISHAPGKQTRVFYEKYLAGTSKRNDDRISGSESFYSRISLGMWGYYFALKLAMYGMHLIPIDLVLNIILAAFILLPVPSGLPRKIKNIITIVPAVALFYHDTWLPPFMGLMGKASLLADFTPVYLFEILTRIISIPVISILLLTGLVYWILSRRLRVDMLIILGMAGLLLMQIFGSYLKPETVQGRIQTASSIDAPKKSDMDEFVNDFFTQESARTVSFSKPNAGDAPFDIIFIHICSVSWDDLRYTGLDKHSLWQNFDILLKNFNTAAGYSAPAAIHLLRSSCGQQRHEQMFLPSSSNCYLFGNLQGIGFDTNLVMNHDGQFDSFLDQLRNYGNLSAPLMSTAGFATYQDSFANKAPIFDDLSVLDRWLRKRQASSSERVALYYNSITMHDGNHLPIPNPPKDTVTTYRARLLRFLDEMNIFMNNLKASGRRAIVVVIPEHGNGIRGDDRQIAGFRETPTPNISIVPVGFKIIGRNTHREGETVFIDEPTSYLAVSYIIERMIAKSPFGAEGYVPSNYVVGLPSTQFVSQTELVTVIRRDGKYYLQHGTGKWEDYGEFNTGGK